MIAQPCRPLTSSPAGALVALHTADQVMERMKLAFRMLNYNDIELIP